MCHKTYHLQIYYIFLLNNTITYNDLDNKVTHGSEFVYTYSINLTVQSADTYQLQSTIPDNINTVIVDWTIQASSERYHTIALIDNNQSTVLSTSSFSDNYNFTLFSRNIRIDRSSFTLSAGEFARTNEYGNFECIKILSIRVLK